MLSKAEFRKRWLADQQWRKQREAQRRADWYAYQSDKGVRLRAGAWKGAGRRMAR